VPGPSALLFADDRKNLVFPLALAPQNRERIRCQKREKSARFEIPFSCFFVSSKKGADVSFQADLHAPFGFLEITPPHQDGQAFTNALPLIILRPKYTFRSNGVDQRHFYSTRPHDLSSQNCHLLALNPKVKRYALRIPLLVVGSLGRVSFRLQRTTRHWRSS
jgi:hypothetical protein